MPDYRPSSVTSMVMPKNRSDKTGGTLHSSWIRNLATFGYLHPYLFLYLNTLIIVPVKQWNEVKNCIWSWNVHGVLRANCLWWQRDRAHLFWLHWCQVIGRDTVWTSLWAQPWGGQGASTCSVLQPRWWLAMQCKGLGCKQLNRQQHLKLLLLNLALHAWPMPLKAFLEPLSFKPVTWPLQFLSSF